MLPFKTRRSAGVPVTAAVHRVLVRANAARDRGDHAAAAAGYRQALAADPSLAHIWLQLGNMAKDLGQQADAADAYAQALRLQPGSAEVHLQLGHLAKLAGNPAEAGTHYLSAFTLDPRRVDAATEVHRALARAHGRTRTEMLDALRAALPGGLPQAPAGVLGGDAAALVFDVSDLVGYWSHGRLPTGIQRVQIQLVTHALGRQGTPMGLCCFIDGRDAWLGVDAGLFGRIMALSLASGARDDPDWIAALHRLHLHLALAPPFAFPHGSTLVNLGSSWQLSNYFLFVRAAKRRYGIRYVPFVHDLIPVLAPQFFTRPARREVAPWVAGVFAHADGVLVNSEATKRDLLQVGGRMDRTFADADVAVIRLDADFRTPGVAALPDDALARWGLAGERFVLLVSTVEGRKGHATALDAWASLIARHGAAAVPRLVCVGKRGWLSGPVYSRLENDAVLASRVSMLSSVADAELALLYRSCLFTLYPSLYEGWGLPITEALSYGAPVIASDASSLPEAGGEFAVYVEPGSAPALADAAWRMASDAPYRDALAARIRAGFKPRGWGDLAAQMQAELARMAERGGAPILPRPQGRLGGFHSLARSRALHVWPGAGSGEAFRVGTGWTAPDGHGSWTGPDGGRLDIALPPGTDALRIGLLLLGAPGCDVDWRIDWRVDWRVDVRDGPSLAGTLERGGRTWATFTCGVRDANGLQLRLRAEPSDEGDDGEREEVLVGLAGFFLYADGDVAAGMRMLEAVALGNLDAVDAFKKPAGALAALDTDWTWENVP